jgi:NAD(P)-dependent dehydrogenase (short-subunit alcohol dehydrogenase family)
MDDKPLNGKVAIVTGGGSGIGKAIALALAQNGAAVALAARTESRLVTTKEEIEAFGGTAEVFPTDIGEVDQCQALVKDVVERLGRLDILVNNAVYQPPRLPQGTRVSSKPLEEVTPEEFGKALSVTVQGTFTLCREAIPHLRKQERAFIINIGTVSTKRCLRGSGVYTTCKNAIRGLSIMLSKELRETSGIRVHLIHPGGTASENFAGAIKSGLRPDLEGVKLMPPKEIADVVLWLVTWQGHGTVDEIYIRRENAVYWCFP